MTHLLLSITVLLSFSFSACTKCTNTRSESKPDLKITNCNTLEELDKFFSNYDSASTKGNSFCIHEVQDGSKNLKTSEKIKQNVTSGLKIAFNKWDTVSWAQAAAACKTLPGGGWKAPESIDCCSKEKETDSGRSLQALAGYLAGSVTGLFWSGSANSLNESQAWILELDGKYTVTRDWIEKDSTRWNGNYIKTICIK